MEHVFLSLWLDGARAWMGAAYGLSAPEFLREQMRIGQEIGEQVLRFWSGVSVCCTDQRCGREEPNPYVGLCDADIFWASKLEHAIQHVSCDGHFGRLPAIRLRSQPVT